MMVHIWQSTLFALFALGIASLLRKRQARIRYWIWFAASVKFLIPLGSISGVNLTLSSRLWLLWGLGAVTVLGVWVLRWRRLWQSAHRADVVTVGLEFETLRRVETSVGSTKPVELRLSGGSLEPGVFGVFKPTLILPAGIGCHLSRGQLEAVIAHEISHLRRLDNLTAAIHMVVEVLFWFHPLVWWIGSKLVDERERACDEEVLSTCRRLEYAEGIRRVSELYLQSPILAVSGVTGSNLKKRIEATMESRSAV